MVDPECPFMYRQVGILWALYSTGLGQLVHMSDGAGLGFILEIQRFFEPERLTSFKLRS